MQSLRGIAIITNIITLRVFTNFINVLISSFREKITSKIVFHIKVPRFKLAVSTVDCKIADANDDWCVFLLQTQIHTLAHTHTEKCKT